MNFNYIWSISLQWNCCCSQIQYFLRNQATCTRTVARWHITDMMKKGARFLQSQTYSWGRVSSAITFWYSINVCSYPSASNLNVSPMSINCLYKCSRGYIAWNNNISNCSASTLGKTIPHIGHSACNCLLLAAVNIPDWSSVVDSGQAQVVTVEISSKLIIHCENKRVCCRSHFL